MTKRSLFRATILWNGKYSGQAGCIFVKAVTKEDAVEYVKSLIKDSNKHTNVSEGNYKLEVFSSSKDEMDFYTKNKSKRNYTGLVN